MKNDLKFQLNDFIKISHLRAFVYKTFIFCFTYPSESWILELPRRLSMLSIALKNFEISTEDMIEIIEEIQKKNYNLQTLQIEYTRLFINGMPSTLALPYASVYSEERCLYGSPAIKALTTYQEAGFVLSSKFCEIPDHLLVELEFLFHLCKKEMENGKNCEKVSDICKKEYYFLTEQLMPWIPIWRKCVEDYDRVGFYTKLAILLTEWLKIDIVYLDNILKNTKEEGGFKK